MLLNAINVCVCVCVCVCITLVAVPLAISVQYLTRSNEISVTINHYLYFNVQLLDYILLTYFLQMLF